MVYHRFTIGLTPICWQVPSGLARLPDAVRTVRGLTARFARLAVGRPGPNVVVQGQVSNPQ